MRILLKPTMIEIKRTYVTFIDVLALLGGSISVIVLIFVTIPSNVFFGKDYFNELVEKRLIDIEKLKSPDS